MRRGTIVLTKFPFTDLSATKRRPCIVISGKLSNKNDVIVAFISSVTTNIESTDYLITTTHNEFATSGLKKDSVIKLDKIATVNLSIITGELGVISDETMQQIDAKIKLALGLS